MNARIEKYLKAYNLVQLGGWLLAIISLPLNFLFAFYTICIVQLLSVLEIYNAHKKWNNSSPFFCFIQIAARLFVLFFSFILLFVSIFRKIPFLYEDIYIMLTAWCIAEIIRYAYYVTQLFKQEIKLITWLRYSAFIICYPVGLLSEFFVLYTVFKYNDVLAVKILMVVVALIYVFMFPKLYLHLFKQRKQKL